MILLKKKIPVLAIVIIDRCFIDSRIIVSPTIREKFSKKFVSCLQSCIRSCYEYLKFKFVFTSYLSYTRFECFHFGRINFISTFLSIIYYSFRLGLQLCISFVLQIFKVYRNYIMYEKYSQYSPKLLFVLLHTHASNVFVSNNLLFISYADGPIDNSIDKKNTFFF